MEYSKYVLPAAMRQGVHQVGKWPPLQTVHCEIINVNVLCSYLFVLTNYACDNWFGIVKNVAADVGP